MQRFLIIRFSSIGDIVLTTPVIRCLANEFPDAEIHYLTKAQYKHLLSANQHLTKVWTIEKSPAEVIRELKKVPFDFIIDLHKNFRSAIVKLRLGKPSGTFRKLNIQKWILVRFKKDFLPEMHIVDRYFESVKKLGVSNDGKGLDFFIEEETIAESGFLPESFRSGYIAWAIGGRHTTKIFPVEKIINVCSKTDRKIVLLGGEEDRARGEAVQASVGQSVYSACGNTGINESAYLVKNAIKVISNDTGLMHIAAAFGKDILSIWGNTVPEFGMYPYLPGAESEILQVMGLPCRPCSKIGYDRCPKGHFKCMMEIEEHKILTFINTNP